MVQLEKLFEFWSSFGPTELKQNEGPPRRLSYYTTMCRESRAAAACGPASATHHVSGLGAAGALQVRGSHRLRCLTRCLVRQLRRVDRWVGGAPQEVVQTAVSPVVGSRTDSKEVWRGGGRGGGEGRELRISIVQNYVFKKITMVTIFFNSF